jgi:glucokinase
MILSGDIGGTKTRLAVFEYINDRYIQGVTETYVSTQYRSFNDIITVMLSSHPMKISSACFGVPGPVIDGCVKTTNLPWILSESELCSSLNIPQVKLVNDLAATTASIPFLNETQLMTVHTGIPNNDNPIYAVVAPGTGLGQGFLAKIGDRFHVFASEGGHVDFAPNTELEMRLWQYLSSKYPQHVSYERVLCGSGLVNIYNFLKDSGIMVEPQSFKEQLDHASDRAAIISQCGLNESVDICKMALDLFCSIMGAQAGNMVLTMMATGGVYLGGGIPPRIAPFISHSSLVASYLNKGRLSEIVARTPLKLICDDHAALIGAASMAPAD